MLNIVVHCLPVKPYRKGNRKGKEKKEKGRNKSKRK